MARRAGLLRNRLNERTLRSWAQTNESLRTADSSSPVIAVMQPAHALLANHGTLFQRACPTSRGLLVQPEVRSVVVIIGNVLGEESLQMALIQRDHVVEQVAAAASDPKLGDPILPGTPNRGTTGFIFSERIDAGTSKPYFASWSSRRNLGAES